jgi:hypothetical protein
MTPALLIRRSSPWCEERKRSANDCTEERLPRSSWDNSTPRPGAADAISFSAASPFWMSRQASTTLAPARASSRAATSPMPLLAPVTIAVRPVWSGICSVLHFALIASPRVWGRPPQGTSAIFRCGRSHGRNVFRRRPRYPRQVLEDLGNLVERVRITAVRGMEAAALRAVRAELVSLHRGSALMRRRTGHGPTWCRYASSGCSSSATELMQ